MSINCSEKCIYQNDGICTLNHITTASGLNNKCPYFQSSHDTQLDAKRDNGKS